METASTDGSDLLRRGADEGDLYTSLLSGQSHPLPQGFSSDSSREAPDRIPSLDMHGVFSSYSGIEVTSAGSMDFTSNPLESEKMEAYNYMDISSGEKPLPLWQQQGGGVPGSWGEVGGPGLGQYMEKKSTPLVETIGPVLGSQTFSYVENLSDEQPSDCQPGLKQATHPAASPIEITLTEMNTKSPAPQRPLQVTVSDRDSILSLGLQGIPTVTLSEPEDDSPGASTPPLTESPPELLVHAGAVGAGGSVQDQVSVSGHAPNQPSLGEDAGDKPVKTEPPAPSRPINHDQDGSGSESGDSVIELVSAEMESPRRQPPSPAHTAPASAVVTPPAPPVQYSILREEREAELDCQLIIESFDASSAAEESTESAQDAPAQKGQRAGPQPANAPSLPASCLASCPASSPAPSPSAAAVLPGTQKEEEVPAEKGPFSGHVEDDPGVKPEAPPAEVLPPEVWREQHALGDEGGKRRRASEGSRDSVRRVFLQGLDRQKVMDLLYWRDLKQTGPVFGSLMLLLFSLTQFSVVSVIAYLALAALSATISFRVYKSVLQAVQKTDEGHPFKSYLDTEVCLSQDQMQTYAEKAQYHINISLKELRRLFLVQDLVDSLKFAVLMWLLTYVGALFNGLTLLILAVVSMFSVPVVYEKYQVQIDHYLGLMRTHVGSVMAKIQEKIPGMKRKEE